MMRSIIDDARLQEVAFTNQENARYSRHLLMPEVGAEGQQRLKAARVLCIGAGGLGSPIAMYLAAAGVGTLGLIDADRVELSNLQRQLLHGTGDIGRTKLESARARLHDLNPHVQVELHEARFTSANAVQLVSGYDVVVDGSDNFPTRYLSSDVCVWAQKPNIYGSIFRFDGQATVFAPHLGGPCYRCLFPQPPPPGTVPSCAEAGVLGVLPGVIGTLQAIETVKLILGVGESLLGRLIHFDALKMRWREFKIRRDPQCPVCGDSPTITEPIDYEQFCSAGATAAAAADELSVHELKQLMDAGEPLLLIDVREPFEYELARIDGARLIPLQQLPRHVDELRAARRVVVHCHSGVRSGRAVDYLRQHGIEAAVNLAGGIDAWSVEIDPAVPRY